MRTLGQFREFTKDIPDDYELKIESYFEPENTKASRCFDYISIDKEKSIIFIPESVYISDGEKEMLVTHKKQR